VLRNNVFQVDDRADDVFDVLSMQDALMLSYCYKLYASSILILYLQCTFPLCV
jgi:hypothetical protein